jgi:hypothetical protein
LDPTLRDDPCETWSIWLNDMLSTVERIDAIKDHKEETFAYVK